MVWGGFVLFWENAALRSANRPDSMVFGMLFVAAGLYLMIGRFFLDAYVRSKTSYALTDNRLLIVREGLLNGIQSFQLSQLPSAQIRSSSAGTGTIDLASGTGSSRSMAAWTPALARGARLLKIENAWQVFTLIQQTQLQSKSGVTGRENLGSDMELSRAETQKPG
jgi:hypothetical protein